MEKSIENQMNLCIIMMTIKFRNWTAQVCMLRIGSSLLLRLELHSTVFQENHANFQHCAVQVDMRALHEPMGSLCFAVNDGPYEVCEGVVQCGTSGKKEMLRDFTACTARFRRAFLFLSISQRRKSLEIET